MLDNKDILLIERKIERSLSKEEEVLFYQKYHSNDEFKKEVIAKTGVLSSLDALNKDELKTEFKGLLEDDKNSFSYSTTSNQNIKWLLSIAAIIMLLILSLFLVMKQKESDPGELFTSNFEPLDNILGSRADENNSPLSIGMHLYDSKNYDSAIFHLNRVKGDPIGQLYLGICYLAINNTKEANGIFEHIIVGKESSILSEYANWFLALSYLKENNYPAAEEKLNIIIEESSSEYYHNALQLLEAINELK